MTASIKLGFIRIKGWKKGETLAVFNGKTWDTLNPNEIILAPNQLYQLVINDMKYKIYSKIGITREQFIKKVVKKYRKIHEADECEDENYTHLMLTGVKINGDKLTLDTETFI